VKKNNTKKATRHHYLAIGICTLPALFYLYEFILQVSPSIITQELSNDFSITTASLGFMAAAYYYAYTLMQIPAGILYDRFGPRRLLTSAIICCALGAFLFANTSMIAVATLGRFLMGFGSAFSFVGTLLLVSRWFPPARFAFIAGLVEMMSCVGAIVGTASLSKIIAHWDWRIIMTDLALIGITLALLVAIIVRDAPADMTKLINTKKKSLHNFYEVCRNNQTWFTALYSFFVWAPITAFAALWGIPFLSAAHNISTMEAAKACTMIWIAIGIGCPLLGWWSDKVGQRCLPLRIVAILGLLALSILIYSPYLSPFMLYSLLFIFGLAASGQSLAFGVVKDNNQIHAVGTAIGINNMATVAGGALFQPLIGLLLHWASPYGSLHNPAAYRIAFLPLPICYLSAWIMSRFFIRETHCLQQ